METRALMSAGHHGAAAREASPLAANGGDLVGAYYFAGWWRSPIPSHYELTNPPAGYPYSPDWRKHFPGREPLTGWYDDTQGEVNREIRIAARGGLDYFVFDWYTNRDNTQYPGAEQNLDNGLSFYLTAPDNSLMKFAIDYINSTNSNPPYAITTAAEWDSATTQWVQYFENPQYLKVNGEPVFIVYSASDFESQWGGAAGAEAALDILIQKAQAAGFPGVLIGGGLQWPGNNGTYATSFARDGYDFYTTYNPLPFAELPAGPMPYKNQASILQQDWAAFQSDSSVPFVPVVAQGFDPRPDLGPNPDDPYLVDGTPSEFGQMLRLAQQAVDTEPGLRLPGSDQGLVLIYAWNEIAEGGELLPHKAGGTAYLDEVHRVFG